MYIQSNFRVVLLPLFLSLLFIFIHVLIRYQIVSTEIYLGWPV